MGSKSFLRLFLGTAGLQLIGKGLVVLTGLFFARALGPESYGRYSFIVSIITVAMLPVVAGLPNLIVREVSKYLSEHKYHLVSGMNRWSMLYVLTMSVLSILILILLAELGIWESPLVVLLFSGLALIPFRGILVQQGAMINGYQRPELAQLPPLILSPCIVLGCSVLMYWQGISFSAQNVIYIQVISAVFACLLSYNLLSKLTKKARLEARQYDTGNWFKSLLPFTILAIVGTMNTELATMMLGFLGDEISVGYFKVALQGITLLALGLQAVNIVSGPKIATLYKQGEIEATQVILKQSVQLSVLSSVPFAILLIVFGEPVIKLLFGHEYLPAAKLLTILCIGQIVNVCMGSVGQVLNMTGNERATLRAQLITLCIMIALLFVLIPLYQGVGAAIAVSIGLVTWNVIMAFDVYRLTGLKTWIFS
ncbi:MAG: flippase [Vibrio litoralis]|uniref:flippase n=1 Tax=Vibrio litoralis TaxID=335972 RepID=UPI003F9E3643